MTTTVTAAPIVLNQTPEKKSWLGEYLSPSVQAAMKARRIGLNAQQIEAIERNAPKGAAYNREGVEKARFPDLHGWSPNPSRKTAKQWKTLPAVINHGSEAVESGTQAREFGTAKVRLLQDDHQTTHQGRGSVVEVGLLPYAAHVWHYLNGSATAEPVEDNEPLVSFPILGMSTDITVARAEAARGLKVEADALTVRQVWEYYANRKISPPEKFHGLVGR